LDEDKSENLSRNRTPVTKFIAGGFAELVMLSYVLNTYVIKLARKEMAKRPQYPSPEFVFGGGGIYDVSSMNDSTMDEFE
jgi:hypothetical protein